LIDGIRLGKVVVLTGAGMSVGSKNQFGNDVIGSTKLCQLVAESAGFEYKGEPIRRVFNAARPLIGDDGLSRILRDNFTGCIPAQHIQDFLRFTWKRLYTFNIDDTILNTRPR
jgi:hypothetical protein